MHFFQFTGKKMASHIRVATVVALFLALLQVSAKDSKTKAASPQARSRYSGSSGYDYNRYGSQRYGTPRTFGSLIRGFTDLLDLDDIFKGDRYNDRPYQSTYPHHGHNHHHRPPYPPPHPVYPGHPPPYHGYGPQYNYAPYHPQYPPYQGISPPYGQYPPVHQTGYQPKPVHVTGYPPQPIGPPPYAHPPPYNGYQPQPTHHTGYPTHHTGYPTHQTGYPTSPYQQPYIPNPPHPGHHQTHHKPSTPYAPYKPPPYTGVHNEIKPPGYEPPILPPSPLPPVTYHHKPLAGSHTHASSSVVTPIAEYKPPTPVYKPKPIVDYSHNRPSYPDSVKPIASYEPTHSRPIRPVANYNSGFKSSSFTGDDSSSFEHRPGHSSHTSSAVYEKLVLNRPVHDVPLSDSPYSDDNSYESSSGGGEKWVWS